MTLILRALSLEVEDAALLAHEELAADGFEFLLDLQSGEPWAAYVMRINGYGRGGSLPNGYLLQPQAQPSGPARVRGWQLPA